MAKKIRVEVNMKELKKIMTSLTAANGYRVKVGILSNKNAREGGESGKAGESNAAIGAIHEYGSYSMNIPQRSFIKMPLTQKSDEIVKEIKGLMQESLDNKDFLPLLKKIGNVAEGIIGNAFVSGGFGTWAPIKPSTAERKGSEAILMDKGFLRGSVASAVVKVS